MHAKDSKAILKLLTLTIFGAIVILTRAARAEPIEHFITRDHDKLMEGSKEFRFISFNIPNLHQIEDDFAPNKKVAWAWPTEFEITDALESVRQMGGTVVRTYVLTVRREGTDMGDYVYVTRPGEFNEEAFQVLDRILAIANEKGIRVIVPLVDEWWWMGGRAEYAAFRDKQPDDFWTDPQVIADFKKTIDYVLNRRNSVTGVIYKNDPTIFGWETGNELKPPAEWTKTIAAYIKSVDPRHLVIDGNSLQGISQHQLDDQNIDVLTTHHYPQPGGNFIEPIRKAWSQCRGKKPYFVGEFGFTPAAEVKDVLDLVVEEGISGALVWSLRFHHREGGFYWHSEPLGEGRFKAYHWPGFASGDAYDETQTLQYIRAAAFKIRGKVVPKFQKPTPPKLLSIEDPSGISWQGSAGASGYDVLRSATANGPWKVVGKNISDAALPYAPLFNDDSAEPGQTYFYAVVAHNSSDSSEPSNSVGPVNVIERTFVDNCLDTSKLASSEGDVQFATGDDRKTREDSHRIKLAPHSSITYQVDAAIDSWTADVYFSDDAAQLKVSASADGKNFETCEFDAEEMSKAKNDYNYLRFVLLSGDQLPPNAKFLRLEFDSPTESKLSAQLGRIAIRYGKLAE